MGNMPQLKIVFVLKKKFKTFYVKVISTNKQFNGHLKL